MSRWALPNRVGKLGRERDSDISPARGVTGVSPRAAWLMSGAIALLVAAVEIGAVGLAAPAAAQVSDQPPAVSAYTVTPARLAASTAAVVGLTAVFFGGLALGRSTGRIGAGGRRRGAIAALVLGPVGLIVGGLVVATADGGLGTGNGLGGGVVAMTVGLIGMSLGGLALARSRRAA
jgi:hypothetical protein